MDIALKFEKTLDRAVCFLHFTDIALNVEKTLALCARMVLYENGQFWI